MHDETCSTLQNQHRQMNEGHHFLKSNGFPTPNVGWQIDMFSGTTRTTPQLFSSLGFKRTVARRIPWESWIPLRENRALEFLWDFSPSPSTPLTSSGECNPDPDPKTLMFTHLLGLTYSSPLGFNFEHDPPVTPENIGILANSLNTQMWERHQWYRHPFLLIPFGGDFQYQNASINYDNMDLVLEYIRDRPLEFPDITFSYGTLQDYFSSVEKYSQENNVTFPTYCGDFLPYTTMPDTVWSGVYTSRPLTKKLIRTTDAIISAAELSTISGLLLDRVNSMNSFSILPLLTSARQNHSVELHHDSIPGTARAIVMQDYRSRLHDAQSKSNQIFHTIFEKKPNYVTVINQYPWDSQRLIIIDVPLISKLISSSLFSYPCTPSPMNSSLSICLVPLPGGSISTFSYSLNSPPAILKQSRKSTKKLFLANKFVNMTFSEFGQPLELNGEPFEFNIVKFRSINSSAYIFRPWDSPFDPQNFVWRNITTHVIESHILSSVRVIFSPWLELVFSLTRDSKSIHLDYTIGPLPSFFEAWISIDLKLEKGQYYFASDEAGHRLSRRTQGFDIPLSTYPLVRSAIVGTRSGNYINIASSYTKGISLWDSNLLISLHRRFQYPGFPDLGLNQPLDDLSQVTGSFTFLPLSSNFDTASRHSEIVNFRFPAVSILDTAFPDQMNAPIYSNFPKNIVPTVYVVNLTHIGVSLVHIFDTSEHPILSRKTCINESQLFPTFWGTKIQSWSTSTSNFLWDNPVPNIPGVQTDHKTIPTPWKIQNPPFPLFNDSFFVGNGSGNVHSTSEFQICLGPLEFKSIVLKLIKKNNKLNF